jgi:hypothetical protein
MLLAATKGAKAVFDCRGGNPLSLPNMRGYYRYILYMHQRPSSEREYHGEKVIIKSSKISSLKNFINQHLLQ